MNVALYSVCAPSARSAEVFFANAKSLAPEDRIGTMRAREGQWQLADARGNVLFSMNREMPNAPRRAWGAPTEYTLGDALKALRGELNAIARG